MNQETVTRSRSVNGVLQFGLVGDYTELLREGVVAADAVNSQGHTALYLTAQDGHRDRAKTLMQINEAQPCPA